MEGSGSKAVKKSLLVALLCWLLALLQDLLHPTELLHALWLKADSIPWVEISVAKGSSRVAAGHQPLLVLLRILIVSKLILRTE